MHLFVFVFVFCCFVSAYGRGFSLYLFFFCFEIWLRGQWGLIFLGVGKANTIDGGFGLLYVFMRSFI